MYTMVMMMAMSGSADASGFGGKLFNRGASCHGSSCSGVVVATGCTGAAPTVPAPTGCSGSSCYGATSCTGCSGGGGFLGLRSHFSRKMGSGCHGSSCSGYAAPSTGCTGYAAPAADCCGAPAAYSTGCVGSVISGGMPGAVITETPAMPAAGGAKEMPKPMKDAPKTTTPPTTPKAIDKTGDGV